VLKYADITQREVEYVSLSGDTTETDLKLRREISAGYVPSRHGCESLSKLNAECRARSAYYTEQAAVRAAIEGRILVLEGIEKAERNVLPILNNLLENREMALEVRRCRVAHSIHKM
jgi:hypothetical protein